MLSVRIELSLESLGSRGFGRSGLRCAKTGQQANSEYRTPNSTYRLTRVSLTYQ